MRKIGIVVKNKFLQTLIPSHFLRTRTIEVDGSSISDTSIVWYEIEYYLAKKWGNITYHVNKFFNPWNKLNLSHLENEYVDRDWVMLHAIFQCVVDFVELEHSMVPWDIRKNLTGRFTDIQAMREYVFSQITPEGIKSYLSGWETPEEIARTEQHVRESAHNNLEILYIYEWYKTRRYVFDDDLILNTPSAFFNNALLDDRHNNHYKIYLTSQEYFDKEEEHKLVCDNMIMRAIKIRRNLWT